MALFLLRRNKKHSMQKSKKFHFQYNKGNHISNKEKVNENDNLKNKTKMQNC